MPEPNATAAFLARCQNLLSIGTVPSDQLHAYTTSCLAIQRHIFGVVRPTNRNEVVAVVQLAAEYGVPLYPISTGHNWGYGEANPVRDGGVIVDLAQMNRIIAFDPDSGVLTIEPGVTQRQLDAFLQQHHYPYPILNFFDDLRMG